MEKQQIMHVQNVHSDGVPISNLIFYIQNESYQNALFCRKASNYLSTQNR